ncbi:MAG: hypothetical protein ACKVQK_13290 [Burkholderiales bacterium]
MNAMGAMELTRTTLLLGAFVLLAGAYAVLFTRGRVTGNPRYLKVGYFFHALQWVATLFLLLQTPLDVGWKLLILGSCIASVAIPHFTWIFLEKMHRQEVNP